MQSGYRMRAVPVGSSGEEEPQAENDDGEWHNNPFVALAASGGPELGKAFRLAERPTVRHVERHTTHLTEPYATRLRQATRTACVFRPAARIGLTLRQSTRVERASRQSTRTGYANAFQRLARA